MSYFLATWRHKWYVFLAGLTLHVPLWRLLFHDWVKFTPAELPHYERQFFGDKSDPMGFAYAWLDHQNRCDHHWEYWVTRSEHSRGSNGVDDGCLPMPEVCVREMV